MSSEQERKRGRPKKNQTIVKGPRGRPKKYTTEEEYKEMKKIYNRTYLDRVKKAMKYYKISHRSLSHTPNTDPE